MWLLCTFFYFRTNSISKGRQQDSSSREQYLISCSFMFSSTHPFQPVYIYRITVIDFKKITCVQHFWVACSFFKRGQLSPLGSWSLRAGSKHKHCLWKWQKNSLNWLILSLKLISSTALQGNCTVWDTNRRLTSTVVSTRGPNWAWYLFWYTRETHNQIWPTLRFPRCQLYPISWIWRSDCHITVTRHNFGSWWKKAMHCGSKCSELNYQHP